MKRTVIAILSFAVCCSAGVNRVKQLTEPVQLTVPPRTVQENAPPWTAQQESLPDKDKTTAVRAVFSGEENPNPKKVADEYEDAGTIEPAETEPTAPPPSESTEWVPPAEEKKAEVSYRPIRETTHPTEQSKETTAPTETRSAETKPVQTEPTLPQPTESTVTETISPAMQPPTEQLQELLQEQLPEETQPQGCNHNWQTVAHEAQGHTELVNACACGYTFESISQYDSHLNDYAGTAEMITVHGHWSTFEIFVVDSPAWSETVCTLCGAQS